MGTKNTPSDFDCYDKALPDEPYFCLLARDPLAPMLLRLWADQRRHDVLAGEYDKDDLRMCTEAELTADEMVAWRKIAAGIWKIPEERRAKYMDDNSPVDNSTQVVDKSTPM